MESRHTHMDRLEADPYLSRRMRSTTERALQPEQARSHMFVIAGATGHVGGGAARELLAKGEKVKVLVRDQAKGK